MNEFIEMLGISYGIIIAVSMVIVEAVKRTELIDKRFLPAISLFIGALSGALVAQVMSGDIGTFAIAGVLAGASASGLYSFGKGLVK